MEIQRKDKKTEQDLLFWSTYCTGVSRTENLSVYAIPKTIECQEFNIDSSSSFESNSSTISHPPINFPSTYN